MEFLIKLNLEPVVKIYYRDYFGIYACNVQDRLTDCDVEDRITLVGNMPELGLYQTYTIDCEPVQNKKYGLQYNFISMERENTKSEQENFLSSLLPYKTVQAIMEVYDNPFQEIIDNTFDYNLVKGIGKSRYKKIRNKIIENKNYFSLLAELNGYGVTFSQIVKLYKMFGDSDKALGAIKDNPYVFMKLPKVGFKKADYIALNMGVVKDDPRRVIAYLEYIIELECDTGSTWVELDYLTGKIKEELGLDLYVNSYLENDDNFVVVDGYKVTLKYIYNTEKAISEKLLWLKNENKTVKVARKYIDNFLCELEEKENLVFDEKQVDALYKIFSSNVFVLTGAAGSGKSKLIKTVIDILDFHKKNYLLISPSAKAAKVMEKYTGKIAYTIHRGLGWTADGFRHNEENKLPHDVVVLDEVSMVGLFLFNHLLDAIGENTKLILIGDPYQLPSIEPGSILDDMIQSELFNSVHLTKIFRQEESSGIIEIATKVRNGERFVSSDLNEIVCFGGKKDAIIIPCNKESIKENTISLYNRLLNKYKEENIMVLSPTRIGEFGSIKINKLLQEINNQSTGKEIITGGKAESVFREGDRVIHIENDYEAEHYNEDYVMTGGVGVFNGTIGKVKQIKDDDSMFVDYGNYIICYKYHELHKLEHSWSLTVAKSQGSGFPVVVFVMDSRNWFQAKRSLLYTAITRASEQLVLVVDLRILNMAIDNNEIVKKRTFLKDLLLELVG